MVIQWHISLHSGFVWLGASGSVRASVSCMSLSLATSWRRLSSGDAIAEL